MIRLEDKRARSKVPAVQSPLDYIPGAGVDWAPHLPCLPSELPPWPYQSLALLPQRRHTDLVNISSLPRLHFPSPTFSLPSQGTKQLKSNRAERR